MTKLKFLMAKEGWTNVALARALGLSPGEMSRYVNGRYAKPYPRIEVALHEIFHLSFKELMQEAEIKE